MEDKYIMKNVKLFEEFVNEASSGACKKLIKDLKKDNRFGSNPIVDNGDNSISFDYNYGDIEDVTYDCNGGTIFIADDETGEWNRDAEPNVDAIATELDDYLRYS